MIRGRSPDAASCSALVRPVGPFPQEAIGLGLPLGDHAEVKLPPRVAACAQTRHIAAIVA